MDDCATLQIHLLDHHIHYYDLRNTKEPVSVFRGHRKAVSYVKWLNEHELVSA
jgi:E3 ubiquitin-protein ligase RFWD2